MCAPPARGYCASISYVDSLIGSLIETLAICGRLDDTIVIFTSDHGDFLGERGLWYKMSFREPAARIPLIVWQPGLFQPRRVHQPVSLADLAPTIAALTGTSQLVAPVDGINLKPLLEGGPEDPDATVYGEYLAEGVIAPMYMLRRGRWKFIHTPSDPDQLFDLVADPLERVNRAADEPALAAAFQQEIESRFDIAAISRKVRDSQRARHLILRGTAGGEHGLLGLPAPARRGDAVHPQHARRHQPRPAIALSAGATAAAAALSLSPAWRPPAVPSPCPRPRKRHRR